MPKRPTWVAPTQRRQSLPVPLGVNVQTQADLAKIVLTLQPPRCFAGGLHRRQQESHERPDDRDDDEQLDQAETATMANSSRLTAECARR